MIKKFFRGSRRGSSVVILTMMFVSIVAAVGIIGEAASRYCAADRGEAALELAGRSVLAEYWVPLKERYGLFAVLKNDDEINDELQLFSEDSLKSFSMTKMSVDSISIECTGYELTNLNIFKGQLREYMKFRAISSLVSDAASGVISGTSGSRNLDSQIEEKETAMEARDAADEAAEAESGVEDSSAARERAHRRRIVRALKSTASDISNNYSDGRSSGTGRVLRSNRVLLSLPSKNSSDSFSSLWSNRDELCSLDSSILSEAADILFIDEYIKLKCRHHLTDGAGGTPEAADDDNSFFTNEIEYIIAGETSDAKNYSKIRNRLYILREGLNISYLITNPSKQSEIAALASLLTPGPFEPLTQLLITAAWAAMESTYDLQELEAGGCVPLIKTNASWHTSIEGLSESSLGSAASRALRGNTSAGSSTEGLDYGEYLNIFLTFTGENQKLLRMMDLIQINLKGTSDEAFTLSRCLTGFNMSAVLKKKSIFGAVPDCKINVSMCQSY